MLDSIGDQPIPWVQPIWEAIFGGLCEVTRFAAKLWASGPPSGSLLLSLEKQVHALAARLICDPLVAHATKEALTSNDLKNQAMLLVKQRPHARLQDASQVVNVRFLGGTVQEVKVPYFLQRFPPGPGRPTNKRGPNCNGFYPTLELLGRFGRVSPALASTVASQLSRSPVDETVSVLLEQGASNSTTRQLHGSAMKSLTGRSPSGPVSLRGRKRDCSGTFAPASESR